MATPLLIYYFILFKQYVVEVLEGPVHNFTNINVYESLADERILNDSMWAHILMEGQTRERPGEI